MATDAAEQPTGDDQLIDDIVDRLLDRLGDAAVVQRLSEALKAVGLLPQPPQATHWLDANEVARLLNRERNWVYAHAKELGVRRIGDGPRPRLLFPPDVADPKNEMPQNARPAKPRKPNGLIPIRGQ